MGFFNLRSGVAPKPLGAASAARPAAPVLRNVRRVVRREAAIWIALLSNVCHSARSEKHSAALSAAADLLGGEGPGAGLDLLPAVPDGNEVPRVANVLERIGLEHEEVGPLALLERA